MTGFVPRPGSEVEKIFKAMVEYPVGTRKTTAEWALLSRTAAATFSASMISAIRHSLVGLEGEPHARYWFRLGPLPPFEKAPVSVTSVFDLAPAPISIPVLPGPGVGPDPVEVGLFTRLKLAELVEPEAVSFEPKFEPEDLDLTPESEPEPVVESKPFVPGPIVKPDSLTFFPKKGRSPRKGLSPLEEKAISALKTLPLGTKLKTKALAELAGITGSSVRVLASRLERAVQRGLLCRDALSLRTLLWYLPYEEQAQTQEQESETTADVYEGPLIPLKVRDREPHESRAGVDDESLFEEETEDDFPQRKPDLYSPYSRIGGDKSSRELQLKFADPDRSNLRETFRQLMDCGDRVKTGDPLMALARLMDIAHRVREAKAVSRFNGAEVDLVVARELSQITISIDRARSNLQMALDTMMQV